MDWWFACLVYWTDIPFPCSGTTLCCIICMRCASCIPQIDYKKACFCVQVNSTCKHMYFAYTYQAHDVMQTYNKINLFINICLQKTQPARAFAFFIRNSKFTRRYACINFARVLLIEHDVGSTHKASLEKILMGRFAKNMQQMCMCVQAPNTNDN